MIKEVAAYGNVVYFCSIIFNNMKTSIFNTIFIEEHEGPDKGLPDGIFITVKLKTILENLVTSYSIPISFPSSKPCLFEGCYGLSTFSYMPRIELKHDSTWDGFGRAYHSSCSYQFTEFHFILYSVDELKQQIMDWDETRTLPYVLEDEPNSAFDGVLTLEDLVSEHWCTELHDFVERYAGRPTKQENLWTADGHSCHPFKNTLFYLHQLAKQVLSGYSPHVSAAKRPRCRSFLMASCRQLSGDDLLGH